MAVHVLTGDDESLLRAAVSTLVHSLVGDGDRALMVDEFDDEDDTVGALIDAAQTAPFLTDSRVVVARALGRFTTDDLAPLISYLAEPLDSTELVLEWGNGRRTKALDAALAAAGATVTSTSAPARPRDRAGWVAEQAAAAGVKLNTQAVDALTTHLGEQVGDLDGLLRTLVAAFGTSAALRVDDVMPFLGDAGGVPPWDLTDAIDAGRTAVALGLLTRMIGAGGRHPLQVMAILQSHYTKLAAIDGLDVPTEADAAAAMGIKPGFPARKAMELSRRLGPGSVRRAIDLLAETDLDLRGQRLLDAELVMEILVARLSRLGR